MTNFTIITSLAVFGTLAFTGTLFPAVEALADFIAASMSGRGDFDAKFVSVGVSL